MTWSVYGRNGHKYSLSGKVGKLWLVSGPRKKELTAYTVQARNELVFAVEADDLNRYGTFKLLLQIREPDSEVEEETYDLTHVFQVVSESYPMTANNAVNGQVDMRVRSILKNVYVSELEGESAYEIAVRNGFEGTESEWLLSLTGIQSISQTESSSESGGLNQVTAILSDGTPVQFSWYNGEQGAEGGSSLGDLSDVTLSSPSRNQVLTYNGTRWVNGSGTSYSYGSGVKISSGNVISADIPQIAAGLIAAGYSLDGGEGGGSGVTTLAGLADVDNRLPVDKQVLGYDASISMWRPMTIEQSSGGGGGDSGGGGGGGEIDPSVLADYVTLEEDETISGQKTFTKQVILTDSLIVGSGTTAQSESDSGAKQRIYFGSSDYYLEHNTNGFFFYGGGVYTNSFMSAGGLSSGGSGGGGGSSTLAGLDDVDFQTNPPEDGQFLSYSYDENTGIGKWVPVSASGVTGDYLPLTGGNMTGKIKMATNQYVDGSGSLWFVHDDNGVQKQDGFIGAANGYGTLWIKARGNIYLHPQNDETTTKGLMVGSSDIKFNDVSIKPRFFYGTSSSTGSTRTVTGTSFTSSDFSNGVVLVVYMEKAADTQTMSLTVGGATKGVYGVSDKKWYNYSLVTFIYYEGGWYLQPTYGWITEYAGGGGGGGGSSATYTGGDGINISNSNVISVTKATTSTLGGVLVGSTTKNPTINSASSTSGKYYPVEMNTSGALFVNVPWVSSSGGGGGAVTSVVSKTGDVTASDISSAIGLSSYLTISAAEQTYLPLSAGSGKPLTNTLYSKGIVPTSNNSYDLGASDRVWNNLYVKKVYLSNGTTTAYFYLDSNGRIHTSAPIVSDSYISAGGVSTT